MAMKTLDEHNEAVKAEREAMLAKFKAEQAAQFNAGVACPRCRKEMRFLGIARAAFAGSRQVQCECGHTGYKLEGKAE